MVNSTFESFIRGRDKHLLQWSEIICGALIVLKLKIKHSILNIVFFFSLNCFTHYTHTRDK